MRKIFASVLLLSLTLFAAGTVAFAQGGAAISATVARVIDGDTFITEGGEKVRLLGINAPEIGFDGRADEPGAKAARTRAIELLEGKRVRLVFGPTQKDRYGRLLAQVYTVEDGETGEIRTWVNRELVAEGLAHVYTFPDNRIQTEPLLKAENAARIADRGLWAYPRWRILQAEGDFSPAQIGHFQLVEGRVLTGAKAGNKIYLNFGPDWRRDFTAEIPEEAWELFAGENINPETDYSGKIVRVRGVLKPINGVLVTVTHPEQIRILGN